MSKAEENPTVELVIYGVIPSLKNQKVMIRRGSRTWLMNKNEVVKFMNQGLEDVPKGLFPEKTPLNLEVILYQENNRRDADIEAIPDLLQKTGVIPNDRYIYRKLVLKRFDKEKPRAEVKISLLGD